MTRLLENNSFSSNHYNAPECEWRPSPFLIGRAKFMTDFIQPHTLSKAELTQQIESLSGIEKLVQVVARLRHPTEGCPWDLKQTHHSLKPFLLEEAYEAVEAIDEAAAGEKDHLKEELGDVLLQVVLHSQIAQDDGAFDFTGVCETIAEKLIRRHPHVFGEVTAQDSETVVKNWEAIKRQEKEQNRPSNELLQASPDSVLKGISKSQPALSRALETSKKAVKVGFEWPSLESLWDCVMSEFVELRQEIDAPESAHETPAHRFERLESEMGDIFFASVNLARHLKIDPEVALTRATAKFTQRFQAMEELLITEGLGDQSLEEVMSQLSFARWDDLWRQAKTQCGTP
jgi:tetrapyrrole methylase family protein/MazG family protein